MTAQLGTLMEKLRSVEAEIEVEMAKRREELRFHLEKTYPLRMTVKDLLEGAGFRTAKEVEAGLTAGVIARVVAERLAREGAR